MELWWTMCSFAWSEFEFPTPYFRKSALTYSEPLGLSLEVWLVAWSHRRRRGGLGLQPWKCQNHRLRVRIFQKFLEMFSFFVLVLISWPRHVWGLATSLEGVAITMAWPRTSWDSNVAYLSMLWRSISPKTFLLWHCFFSAFPSRVSFSQLNKMQKLEVGSELHLCTLQSKSPRSVPVRTALQLEVSMGVGCGIGTGFAKFT